MIKNNTRKTIISRKEKYCNNFFSKGFGLMFSRKIDKALVFSFRKESRVSLHMFFVFYPIDVIFIDEKKRAVELKEGLRPFRFFMPKKRAKYIIELPAGMIKKTKTQVGDKIIL